MFFQYVRPAFLVKNLHCKFVHHNNPYLEIGPFKFELMNQKPEIGLIHELVTSAEAQAIQNIARGNTKSTPYNYEGESQQYSKGRTSKIMYMNEKLVPDAMVLAKRIELATRFKLYNERKASENFQVMNYGIGGKISFHTDTPGEIFSEGYSGML